ncbi:lysophospholipid acyltransferase family protein [Aliiroseovarius subalbicans]|uniref:lysophospholipid acyltransferase family protein n=1 Tax=Aliiroseovarius subalbicans TaxID=2925840 RepID=UPI001F579B15|nr:lysophospholipid acyltransferase family protein [Aliiroseovarius subalbicans]MCI2399539.1 1-acyl-sn-glycerol-3-phosphate acyltransferase [Aliiroseovarius subalbicans]
MRTVIQWILSLLFIIQMYLMMVLMALYFTPLTLFGRHWAFKAVHTYCRWVRWSADKMVGLKSEIRGEVPTGEAIIASKHQSFFDIIMIVSVVPEPKFIMKKEILWTPIVGYYGKALGCIPVDRGKRGVAIKKMVADVKSGASAFGQLIIFPQGTRVAAGAHKKYKIGTGVLYKETERPCVPAATNVGVFWPRHGIMRRPGLAVVEFMPAITPGLEMADFMVRMERDVEENSDRLMVEAGLSIKDTRDGVSDT